MAKQIINVPDDVRERLERMAEETSLSMNALANLAIQSLVANYEVKGSFIFADLLNPDHRYRKEGK
jgi:predicted transcriptional regulator